MDTKWRGAFVVITTDDKQGTIDPEIYGPFASDEEAQEFITHYPGYMRIETGPFAGGFVIEPIDGGYVGAHVISCETATDPAGVAAEDVWL